MTKPRCGPSQNAISHMHCASGYEVYWSWAIIFLRCERLGMRVESARGCNGLRLRVDTESLQSETS